MDDDGELTVISKSHSLWGGIRSLALTASPVWPSPHTLLDMPLKQRSDDMYKGCKILTTQAWKHTLPPSGQILHYTQLWKHTLPPSGQILHYT